MCENRCVNISFEVNYNKIWLTSLLDYSDYRYEDGKNKIHNTYIYMYRKLSVSISATD